MAQVIREIAFAAQRLRSGELVAVPTETVYGLGADAFNPQAVRRVFEVKGRPLLDPLIVHIGSMDQLDCVCAACPERMRRLAAKFWPGPLTMVLPKAPGVNELVTAGLSTVAVRMPSHPMLRSLLLDNRLVLAAPSANPFGYVSPTCPEHVIDSLGDRLNWVLDGGPCQVGVESTILSLAEDGPARLLRYGPIGPKELEAALGETVLCARRSIGATVEAPGMLMRHYSPGRHLVLFRESEWQKISSAPEDSWLWQKRPAEPALRLPGDHFWFSETGELAEVAQNLFSLLRRLDNASGGVIRAQLGEGEGGLSLAINDRLTRAAAEF